MRLVAFVLALSVAAPPLVGGCDRAAPAPPTPRPTTTTPSIPIGLDLWPVAALLPGRTTHVAVDPRGNVFWCQETDGGDDVVFVTGAAGVPRATRVSSAALLAAGGATAVRGGGTIQSLAAASDGAIYVYFSGGVGRQVVACLARFDPAGDELRVLADTARLEAATGMGASLALARGTLVAHGPRVWLWVRHSDDAVLLRLDVRDLPRSGTAMPVRLERPIDVVRTPDGQTLNLRRDGLRLAAGAAEALVMLDVPAGELRSIDAGTGVATTIRPLVGLSRALSRPTTDDAGRVLVFAGDDEPIPARTAEQVELEPPVVTYPALLLIDAGAVASVERDAIGGHAGLRVHALRLRQLEPERIGPGWIGYDETSGELLRVRPRGTQ